MVLLRWSRHLASSLALVALVACASFGQSSRPPDTDQQSTADERKRDRNAQLAAITSELRAIREQHAKSVRQEADYQASQQGPIWSNWVLAGLAAVASFIGGFTLRANKDAAEATAIAAKATLASVDQADRHFKLANQQWMNGAWTAHVVEHDGFPSVTIDFKLINTTRMAVTLLSANSQISEWNLLVEPDTLKQGHPYDFPPREKVVPPEIGERSLPIGRFDVDTPRLLAQFHSDEVIIKVLSKVSYRDAFGDPRTQPFDCLVIVAAGKDPQALGGRIGDEVLPPC